MNKIHMKLYNVWTCDVLPRSSQHLQLKWSQPKFTIRFPICRQQSAESIFCLKKWHFGNCKTFTTNKKYEIRNKN